VTRTRWFCTGIMEWIRSKLCWYDRFDGGMNPITVADCVVFDADPLVAHTTVYAGAMSS
jgi:hypothetical protein